MRFNLTIMLVSDATFGNQNAFKHLEKYCKITTNFGKTRKKGQIFFRKN